MNTVPYINFKSFLADKLINDKLFDAKWFDYQSPSISIWWNAGESVDSAYEMLKTYADAQLGGSRIRSISPYDSRICTKVTRFDECIDPILEMENIEMEELNFYDYE